jgi:CheY-like chemotaxis protein
LEAVQKAQELKPDLVLLDIGLPSLNGLEAAIRIVEVAPNAKIVFLTQDSDRDVVRAALSTGAQGYVLKPDAGTQLFTALEPFTGSLLDKITFSTSIPSCPTALLGLPFGRSFQRSSVSRTAGKSCQLALGLASTWSNASSVPATSAIFRACAKATSLAAEKSEGWKMDFNLTLSGRLV